MSTASQVVHRIEQALARNPLSGCGLLVRQRVFVLEYGASNAPEMLALIHADDSFVGYWYGHVLRHHDQFISLIVWSKVLINADSIPLLFRRFHYWMSIRHEYEACTVQVPNDAYAEASSWEQAVRNLAVMINHFDLKKRSPGEDSPYACDPVEMRIIGVYGLQDHRDTNGRYPPVPMPTPLRIVGGHP